MHLVEQARVQNRENCPLHLLLLHCGWLAVRGDVSQVDPGYVIQKHRSSCISIDRFYLEILNTQPVHVSGVEAVRRESSHARKRIMGLLISGFVVMGYEH